MKTYVIKKPNGETFAIIGEFVSLPAIHTGTPLGTCLVDPHCTVLHDGELVYTPEHITRPAIPVIWHLHGEDQHDN